LLSSKRFVHILPKQLILLADPTAESPGVIILEAGVDAEILACEIEWCRLGIASKKGWARKSALWGVYDDEEFD
jgi:SH3-like domain-containing protein